MLRALKSFSNLYGVFEPGDTLPAHVGGKDKAALIASGNVEEVADDAAPHAHAPKKPK